MVSFWGSSVCLLNHWAYFTQWVVFSTGFVLKNSLVISNLKLISCISCLRAASGSKWGWSPQVWAVSVCILFPFFSLTSFFSLLHSCPHLFFLHTRSSATLDLTSTGVCVNGGSTRVMIVTYKLLSLHLPKSGTKCAWLNLAEETLLPLHATEYD